MAKPLWVVAGIVLALLGLLFTLQGVGVMEGSSMSDTTTWSILGPIILLVGIGLASVGFRGATALTELDGTPVGRRVVLGLLGLGAVGVVAGKSVQEGLSHLLAPIQLRDPTGFTSLIPLGNTWRYYSVTGAVTPRDPASYELKVFGRVAHPVTYSFADLEALAQTSFTDTFQCVTGWHVPDVPWTGVRLADLLDLAAPTAEAVGVRFRSFDGTYAVNMTLEQARADDVIVALSMYGEPVTHDHGGPVRIYSGSMYGYKSTKWLSEIELTQNNLPGYWEDRGYPLDGIIGE